jgi:transposase InsO family protein
VLKVSRSGYYEWRGRPVSERDWDDAHLLDEIRDVHAASRATYGAPRVHAELKLGRGHRIGRKRVARLMRTAELQGICHRRKGRHRPAPAVHDDLVQRSFSAERPDQLWCTDITEHPTREGKVYCAAILDVFSRRIVGWSIADHIRSELVVDALQMATWRRQPDPGAVVHSDRGSQGEINRSSQHLDSGGATWRPCESVNERCSSIGDRSPRRDDPAWHGERTGSGSGRLSLAV